VATKSLKSNFVIISFFYSRKNTKKIRKELDILKIRF